MRSWAVVDSAKWSLIPFDLTELCFDKPSEPLLLKSPLLLALCAQIGIASSLELLGDRFCVVPLKASGGELPNFEDGGLPAGVKDRSDEPGGGPAGVVDGFDAKLLAKGLVFRLLSGVEGGLEENGTWNVDIGLDGCKDE